MARLFAWSAANGLRVFPLPADTTSATVIGRGADCDVPLTSETKLSRQHVKVVRDGDGWAMEDMGSSNGTFFGARRIKRQTINDADVFSVGPLHLQVRLDDSAPCTIPGAADETQPAGFMPTVAGGPSVDLDATMAAGAKRTASGVSSPSPSPSPSGARPVSGRRPATASPMPIRRGEQLLRAADRKRRRLLLGVFGVLLIAAGAVWVVAFNRGDDSGDNTHHAATGTPDSNGSEPGVPASNAGNQPPPPRQPQDDGPRITALSDVRVPLPVIDADVSLQIDMRLPAEQAVAATRERYLQLAEQETVTPQLPWSDARSRAAGMLFDRAARGKIMAHIRAQEMVDRMMEAIGHDAQRSQMEAAAQDLMLSVNSDWDSAKGRLPRILNALRDGAGLLDEPLPPPPGEPTTPLGRFVYNPEPSTRATLVIDLQQPLMADDFERVFRAHIASLQGELLPDMVQSRRETSAQALRRVHRVLTRLHQLLVERHGETGADEAGRRLQNDMRLTELVGRAVHNIEVPPETLRVMLTDKPLPAAPTYAAEVVPLEELPILVSRVRQLPADKREVRLYDMERSARVRLDLKFESVRHADGDRMTLSVWSLDGRRSWLLQAPRTMSDTVLQWKKWDRLIYVAPLRRAFSGLQPDLSQPVDPRWIRAERSGLVDLQLPTYLPRATAIAAWAGLLAASTDDHRREMHAAADGRYWLVSATVTAVDPATGSIRFSLDDAVVRGLTARDADSLRQPDPQVPDLLRPGMRLILGMTFDGTPEQPRFVLAGVNPR